MTANSNAVFRALLIAMLVLAASSQRTFVPNGRYGKRAEIPVVVGVQSGVGAGGDEMPSSLILGERLLTNPMYLCTHTGVSDYYRCSRRSSASFDEAAQ